MFVLKKQSKPEKVSLIHKPESEEEKLRRRLIRTLCMGMFHLTLGLYVGILGPAIPDILEIQNCTVSQLSLSLTFKNIGIFVGSLSGGLLSDHFRPHVDLFLCIFSMTAGLMNALIPWAPNLVWMALFEFIQGFDHGALNVVVCSAIMTEWRERSGPAVNYVHTMFSVGLLVAPFTTAPFLSPQVPVPAVNTTDVPLNETSWLTTSAATTTASDVATTLDCLRNSSTACPDQVVAASTGSRIFIPFLIHGLVALCAGLVFLGFYWAGWPYREPDNKSGKSGGHDNKNKSQSQYRFVLGVNAAIVMLYFAMGNRDNPLQILNFYVAVEEMYLSKSRAVIYSTVFNACWVLGRINGIVLAKFLQIHWLIHGGTILALINNIMIYVFSLDTEALFWTFTCLTGIVCGPFYASVMSWVNEYTPVNGVQVAMVDIGLGVGAFAGVSIGGYVLDEIGPSAVFLQALLATSCILAIIVPLQAVFSARGTRFKDEPTDRDTGDLTFDEEDDNDEQ